MYQHLSILLFASSYWWCLGCQIRYPWFFFLLRTWSLPYDVFFSFLILSDTVTKIACKNSPSLIYAGTWLRLCYLWYTLFISNYPSNIHLLKANNRNTRKRCEICLKLTIKIFRTYFYRFYCRLWRSKF